MENTNKHGRYLYKIVYEWKTGWKTNLIEFGEIVLPSDKDEPEPSRPHGGREQDMIKRAENMTNIRMHENPSIVKSYLYRFDRNSEDTAYLEAKLLVAVFTRTIETTAPHLPKLCKLAAHSLS